jgi:hypothetical protein
MRTITKALAALVVGAGLVGLSRGALAQAPTTDPWKLSQTADSCYLQRSFGTGERKVDLLIQAFGSTTPYHVMIRGGACPCASSEPNPRAWALAEKRRRRMR